MTRWHPDRDLARLIEALSQEILAASDEELRQALAETGWSIARAASEVRALVAAAAEGADEPGAARPHAAAVGGMLPQTRPQ
jgi:hypothetical protein